MAVITLIYWILCALGILEFTWWVPFVESLAVVGMGSDKDSLFANTVVSIIAQGIATFCFCCLFCDLQVNPWFVLISPVVFVVALYFPGGFTIFNLVMKHFGLMNPPIWVIVLGVIADIALLYMLVMNIRYLITGSR